MLVCIVSIVLLILTFIGVSAYLKDDVPLKDSQKRDCLVLALVGIILAVLDFTNIIDSSSLNGLLGVVGSVVALVLVSIHLLDSKLKDRSKFRFTYRSILVVLALEVFVFNFNAYHTVNQKLTTSELQLGDAILTNLTLQDDGTLKSDGEGSASIEYLDFSPIHIQTLSVDVTSEKKSTIECSVDYNETSHVEYRYGGVKMEIINGDTKSQTVPTYFSGDTTKLKFNFNVNDGDTLTISSIKVNQPYGMHFSIVRYLILFLGVNYLYYLLHSKKMQTSVESSERVANLSVSIITVVLACGAVCFASLYMSGRSDGIASDFSQTSGNQITQEIVDAFANGQVSLLREVEPELLALDNPYDWSQRDNISYAWDHVMYEGKYYSYYGIAPVLLIFLPYFKLTGYYFPSTWAVMIFCIVGIVFLSKLYYEYVLRYFSHIPIGIMNMCLIILQLSTGVWFCMATPNFYEIAQSSGFACVAVGAYFMLSSNVVGGSNVIKWRVALATVFLSLGVLCRPTLVLYCFIALIFLAFGWKKESKLVQKKLPLQYLACALLPFVLIGGIQVWYNYARFGSIVDFGIEYSLTINDFTTAQYHTQFVAISVYNFLLAFPSFSTDFPFFQSSHSNLNCYGYYFIATSTSMGLIFRALPMFSYVHSREAYRLVPKEKRLSTLALIVPLCVVAPLVIIFSVWESGYAMRYGMDFTWQLLFGAYAIMFTIYNSKPDEVKKVQYKGIVLAMAISFVLNFAQVYSYTISNMQLTCQEGFYKFAHLFEFWL